MRLVLASLIVAVAVAPLALAQTPPTAPPASTPPVVTPPPSAAVQTTPAPPPQTTATPSTVVPTTSAPAVPPPPPPPPEPPTDPAAIVLMSTLQDVCIPAIAGGNRDQLAKADGFRKSGEDYVRRGRGFQFSIRPPGSNPDQCQVDIVHPIDPEAPAKPMVVALHNWAAVERQWTLYRNDKSVTGAQELTTRSWEHDDGAKHEALVITTYRRADGSPSQHSADTSTLIYSLTKNPG